MHTPPAPNLILMGLRGSGKSTLGRLAAARLGRVFIDLDDRVMNRLGCSTVSDAWRAAGEPAFRRAEVEQLCAVLREHPSGLVLALGGGTPTAPGAEEVLRGATASGAALVYLRCTAEELRARMHAAGGPGPNRPSLTGADPLAEIDEVLAARDPRYLAMATTIIESPCSREEALNRLVAAR